MCSRETLLGIAERSPNKPVDEPLGNSEDRRMHSRLRIGTHSMTTIGSGGRKDSGGENENYRTLRQEGNIIERDFRSCYNKDGDLRWTYSLLDDQTVVARIVTDP